MVFFLQGLTEDDRVTRIADTKNQRGQKEVGLGSTDSFIFNCGKDNVVFCKHPVNNIL